MLQAALVTDLLFWRLPLGRWLWALGIAAFLGVVSDLIPFIIEGSNYASVYLWFHDFVWWKDIIYPIGLHTLTDYLTHDHLPPYGWKSFTLGLEIVLDSVLLFYFYHRYLTKRG